MRHPWAHSRRNPCSVALCAAGARILPLLPTLAVLAGEPPSRKTPRNYGPPQDFEQAVTAQQAQGE